jgi:hypothetical protein
MGVKGAERRARGTAVRAAIRPVTSRVSRDDLFRSDATGGLKGCQASVLNCSRIRGFMARTSKRKWETPRVSSAFQQHKYYGQIGYPNAYPLGLYEVPNYQGD